MKNKIEEIIFDLFRKAKCRENHIQYFKTYNKNLHSFIKEIQAGTVCMLEKLLPATQEEIAQGNKYGLEF